MTLLAALTLFFVMVTLAAIPSASVALVVVRSATAGVPHGLAVTAGIVLADVFFVVLVVAGLSVLAEWMGSFFVLLRYVAGMYLIWFGLQLLRSIRKPLPGIGAERKYSRAGSFLAGFVLTLGDLKAILFYASLFPVFVDLTLLTLADVLLLVGVTVVTVGGVKSLYALAARRLTNRYGAGPQGSALRAGGGIVMIGTGSWLVLKT